MIQPPPLTAGATTSDRARKICDLLQTKLTTTYLVDFARLSAT